MESTVSWQKQDEDVIDGKSKTSIAFQPFTERWHIVSMPQWDEDFIDAEVQGFIEFDDKNSGRFQFGYVSGDVDCRLTTRDGELPSSGPGTAMMRWTMLRAKAGPS